MRLTIVFRLIKPEVLRQRTAMGRELKLLKQLQATFPDDAFWLQLQPHERLDSLCWFKTAYGRESLEEQWRVWQIERSEEQRVLDTYDKPSMIGESNHPSPARQPRRPTALEWADGS